MYCFDNIAHNKKINTLGAILNIYNYFWLVMYIYRNTVIFGVYNFSFNNTHLRLQKDSQNINKFLKADGKF